MRKPISFSNGNMGVGKDKTKLWNSNVLKRSKIDLSTSARCQTLDWVDESTSGIKGLILSYPLIVVVYKVHCAVQCAGKCGNIERCSCWGAHDLFWNSAKKWHFWSVCLGPWGKAEAWRCSYVGPVIAGWCRVCKIVPICQYCSCQIANVLDVRVFNYLRV